MTVQELIEKLQELPEDQKQWEVVTEGCDCIGNVNGVATWCHWYEGNLAESHSHTIVITRDN